MNSPGQKKIIVSIEINGVLLRVPDGNSDVVCRDGLLSAVNVFNAVLYCKLLMMAWRCMCIARMLSYGGTMRDTQDLLVSGSE